MITKPLALTCVSLLSNRNFCSEAFLSPNSNQPRFSKIKTLPKPLPINADLFHHRAPFPNSNHHSQGLHGLRMITNSGSRSADSPDPFAPFSSPLPMGIGFNVIGKSAYPLWEFKFQQPTEKKLYQSQQSLFSIDIRSLLPNGAFYLSFGSSYLGLRQLGSEGLHSYSFDLLDRQFHYSLNQPAHDIPGVMLVPKQCPEDVANALITVLSKVSNKACSNKLGSLSSLLSDLGFSLSSHQLRCLNQKDHIGFLETVLTDGLTYQDQKIFFNLVKTTPTAVHEILCEQKFQPMSHHLKMFQRDHSLTASSFEPNTLCLRADKLLFSGVKSTEKALNIETSKTTALGGAIRQLMSPNILMDVNIEPALIHQYLPEKLPPFPHPNPDLSLRIKKDLLFNPLIASTIYKQMVVSFNGHHSVKIPDLLSFLSDHSNGESGIFNCIITDSSLLLSPTKVSCEPIDIVLSKHVFMSQYKDVRFAGELRIDGDAILINRNSGTYIPEEKHLSGAIELLNEVFPNVDVLGENLEF